MVGKTVKKRKCLLPACSPITTMSQKVYFLMSLFNGGFNSNFCCIYISEAKYNEKPEHSQKSTL